MLFQLSTYTVVEMNLCCDWLAICPKIKDYKN